MEEPALEELVVLGTPRILSSENIVVPSLQGGATVGTANGASRGVGAGAELGRRLLLAARAGDAQAVRLLMAQGAPFTTDWLGTSPLHLAAAGGHAQAAAVLLRAGVSRDARTKVERTPLHLAAHAGHVAVAQVLLDHGAMLDCRDMLHMTPLHWACARGHAALAALLVARGADTRARCKFNRTALQLAAPHPATRRALRDAHRARAHHTVRPLTEEMVVDEATEDAAPAQSEQDGVTRSEQDGTTTSGTHNINKPDLENEQRQQSSRAGATAGEETSGEGGAGGGGGAAALLRQHGITLLPADDGSTVLSALQSGRTVVLSDAGKLMLKENSSPPASPAPASTGRVASGANGASSASGSSGASSTAGTRARGVVVRAWPARSPPRPGVKVFTVNKLTRTPGTNSISSVSAVPAPATAAPATPATPVVRKILNPQDMQIKYVQLPPDATIISPGKTPMKAKNKIVRPAATVQAKADAEAEAEAGAEGGNKPGVKIIMNKASFSKLLATATRAHHSGDNEPLTGLSARGEAVVCVPEQFVRSMSARYLRAQLLAAHAALAALSKELRAARAQLRAHGIADTSGG